MSCKEQKLIHLSIIGLHFYNLIRMWNRLKIIFIQLIIWLSAGMLAWVPRILVSISWQHLVLSQKKMLSLIIMRVQLDCQRSLIDRRIKIVF